ncbi:hypothetical protein M422DRAFT_264883, partial [Sphaerobolus stellatus SS14]
CDFEEEVSGFQGPIEGEISDETALEIFIKTLQDAQKAAQEEELQKNPSNKHPKHYAGNSERTQYCHAARHRTLAADGKTQFITSFFQKSKSGSSSECSPLSGIEDEVLKTEGVSLPEDVLEDSSDQGENLGDTDCGSSLQRESSPDGGPNMSHQLTADEHLQELLCNLGDYNLETATDQALRKLDWQDFPAL